MSKTNKIILKILFISILFLIGCAFICYYFNNPAGFGVCFIGYSIGLKLTEII